MMVHANAFSQKPPPKDASAPAQVLGVAGRAERPVLLVSDGESGKTYAWTSVQLGNVKATLIRADVESGETKMLDLTPLGAGEQAPVLWKAPEGKKIVAFAGKPPRFIEVETEAMTLAPHLRGPSLLVEGD